MWRAIFLFTVIVVLASCEKETEQTNYYHSSYRANLWSILDATEWTFDFIGTRYDDGLYPPTRMSDFDRNHEGISGIQSFQVLERLETVLDQTGAPDIVLLGIGINDIFFGRSAEDITADIEQIIEVFRKHNPKVSVFVEQVAPTIYSEEASSNLEELKHMNEMIGEMTKQLSKPHAKVISVDMHSGWRDNYFIDDIHYNMRGSIEVATRYYAQMMAHLDPNRAYKIMSIGDSRVEGSRPEKI